MPRPDSAEARRKIVEIIGNSVYHALGLKEILEEEREALEKQDMTALQAALDEKGRCVEALRDLESERSELCDASGIRPGPQQMPQMIEWCDETSIVANCWQHLMEIAIDCNLLNTTNGAIIRGRKQQIESSIAVIRGGESGIGTYDRNGTEPSPANMRSIVEA